MGSINFKDNSKLSKRHLRMKERIQNRLRAKGLKMWDLENWEFYDIDAEVNHWVYVGKARVRNAKRKKVFWVAITPTATLKIDDLDTWFSDQESKI